MSLLIMPTQPHGNDNNDSKIGFNASTPAWGSYLYQNFLLPALSPSLTNEWLNSTPLGGPINISSNNSSSDDSSDQINTPGDYFGQSWTSLPNSAPTNDLPISNNNASSESFATSLRNQSMPEVNHSGANTNFFNMPFPSQFYFQNSGSSSSAAISTSLLVNATTTGAASSSVKTNNNQGYDLPQTNQWSQDGSPSVYSATPNLSPKLKSKKRRASSMDSDDIELHSHDEAEPDVPEGVERDGMIWGMKVEDYRALSARERKRVRNRISARTFRAKRKEHLSSLEHTISNKDLQIKLAQEESTRLRQEVVELKRRLAKYEKRS